MPNVILTEEEKYTLLLILKNKIKQNRIKIRAQVILAVANGIDIKTICQTMGISKGGVYSLIKKWNDKKIESVDFHKHGNKNKLNEDALKDIIAFAEKEKITSSEIAARINIKHGIKISSRAITERLKNLGYECVVDRVVIVSWVKK